MTSRLSDEELASWGGFLQTHARVTRELDEDLRREHDMSLSTYDVLTQVDGADGGTMRMSELAEAVLLSRSGLTRLVDRLEREGLLRRRECDEDARGANAELTEEGRRRLEEARPTHHAGIRRLFTDRLDSEQRRELAGAWERIRG